MAKNDPQPPLSIEETSKVRSIRYMSFQGGGMKGVGNAGVGKALAESGILAQLEEVAGSSVGAIVATLIAVGCTPEEMQQYIGELNFKDFEDPEDAGWIESSRIGRLVAPLSSALETVDGKLKYLSGLPLVGSEVAKSSSYFSYPIKALKIASKIVEGAEWAEKGFNARSTLGIYKGDALSHWLAGIIAKKTGKPNLTFAELAKLSKGQHSPYKKLTVTGSNLTKQKLEYFNETDYPDMPIVEAVRISGSFPGAFMPIRRKDRFGTECLYVDGGLVENLPDVFNRPPYLPSNLPPNQTGNPAAAAVVFGTQAEYEKPGEINSLLALGEALYSTALSDKRNIEKYGKNVIYIDTVGVGTLAFDTPRQKLNELMKSGEDNTHKMIQELMIEEQKIKFENLSTEELIRQQVVIMDEKKQKLIIERETLLNTKLKKINKVLEDRIKKGETAPENLQELSRTFEARLQKAKKLRDLRNWSDESLLKDANKKLKELDRIRKDNIANLGTMRVLRDSLIFKRESITSALHAKGGNNDLMNALHDLELNRLENQIIKNRVELLNLGFDKLKSRQNIENHLQKLLKSRKEKLFQKLSFFKKQNNTVAISFFEDLIKDSNNTKFRYPTTLESVKKYYNNKIKDLEKLIKEGKSEIENSYTEHEEFKKIYKRIQKQVEEQKDKQSKLPQLRSTRSEQFNSLIELEKKLKQSIIKKSTVWGKIYYKVSQYVSPSIDKWLLKPFFQTVSFAGFAVFTSVFSIVPILPIANAIRNYSTVPETQDMAHQFLSFFEWTDVDFESKLRGLTKTASLAVEMMGKNYENDKSESSYIYKTFANYFKGTGLNFKDVLEKDKHESDKQFEERVKKIEKVFAMDEASNQVLIEHRLLTQKATKLQSNAQSNLDQKHALDRQPAQSVQNQANQKINEFRRAVLSDVLKITEPKTRAEYSKMSSLKAQNITQIDKEYVASIDKKCHNNIKLEDHDIQNYVKAKTALTQEYSPIFAEKYKNNINKNLDTLHTITMHLKKGSALEPEEIKAFKKYMQAKPESERTIEEIKIYKEFNDRYQPDNKKENEAKRKESELGKKEPESQKQATQLKTKETELKTKELGVKTKDSELQTKVREYFLQHRQSPIPKPKGVAPSQLKPKKGTRK